MTTEISYIIGSAEALEAEFGVDAGGPFAIVQFYRGEVAQWFPCATLDAARAEVREWTDGGFSVL